MRACRVLLANTRLRLEQTVSHRVLPARPGNIARPPELHEQMFAKIAMPGSIWKLQATVHRQTADCVLQASTRRQLVLSQLGPAFNVLLDSTLPQMAGAPVTCVEQASGQTCQGPL